MSKNTEYSGRIDPGQHVSMDLPWIKLIEDRYLFAKIFCVNKAVLDSCCGTGWGTVNFISSIANNVIGFDLATNQLVSEKIPENTTFYKMDALQPELEKNSFDTVLSLDAIEHFKEDDSTKYLSNLAELMKHDGLLLGTTPLVAHKNLVPVYLNWNKYHYNMYTRQKLEIELSGQFRHFRIFEIYHSVCPYFLFIGSNVAIDTFKSDLDVLKQKLIANRYRYVFNRQKHAVRWIARMLKRGHVLTSALIIFNDGLKGSIKEFSASKLL